MILEFSKVSFGFACMFDGNATMKYGTPCVFDDTATLNDGFAT